MLSFRFKVLFCAILATLVLLSVSHRSSASGEPRRWALVVGVDHYDSTSISPLSFAGADAKEFARALTEVGGFSRDRVILMTSESDVNQRPTSENILEWLENMRREVGPGDIFVFFFSGHGVVRGDESYLVTSNTKLGSDVLMKKSALAVREVQEALKGIRATHLLQIVDACRNDPTASRGIADNKMSPRLSRDLAVVAARPPQAASSASCTATLFACSVNQRSYEGYKGHGYFTYFLVEGLRGEARDRARQDGAVTLNSLVEYVATKVPETVRLHEHGQEQVPIAKIEGTGQAFVLSTPGGSTAYVPASPPPPTASRPQPAPIHKPTPEVAVAPSNPGRTITARNDIAFLDEMKAFASGPDGEVTIRSPRLMVSLRKSGTTIAGRSQRGSATWTMNEFRTFVGSLELKSCASNLKNIATALEMWMTDNRGAYPASLQNLLPNYLRIIPLCPAAGTDTYSTAYRVASSPAGYVVRCGGHHHAPFYAADQPFYTSEKGLENWPPTTPVRSLDMVYQ